MVEEPEEEAVVVNEAGLGASGVFGTVEVAGFLADLRGFISATVTTLLGTLLEVRGH